MPDTSAAPGCPCCKDNIGQPIPLGDEETFGIWTDNGDPITVTTRHCHICDQSYGPGDWVMQA